MERKLSNAALQGNVPELISILREDPLILHRCTTLQTKSPLHISAEVGQVEFSQELLRQSPQLAEMFDSHRSSPLHSAASRGHIEIVKALIRVNPNMCFARDEEGRNPVHVAAMNGQLLALDELVRAMPRAAKERAGNEGSILHLCVKYNELECLTMLLNSIGDGELLNCEDCEGNTILHLAVAGKQIEMLDHLLRETYWIDKNSTNNNGLTPMDTFHHSREGPYDKDVRRILRCADLRKSSNLKANENWNKHLKWLEDHRSSLMLVASLIAQMAFQAGLNPPGGLYQNRPNIGDAIAGHEKGRRGLFNLYLVACSVSWFSSLSVILMLISGLRCRKTMVYASMAAMWIAILPMPLVYWSAITIFTPENDCITKEVRFSNRVFTFCYLTLANAISFTGACVWVLLLLFILVGHVTSFIKKILKL